MTTWALRKTSVSARVLHHIRSNKMFYRLSICVVLFAFFVGWFGFSWLSALFCTFGIYLVSGGWRFVRLFCLTFPRDFRGLLLMIQAVKHSERLKRKNQTVADVFLETLQKHSNKVAFIFEDKQWTFQEVEVFSNKVANYFQNLGYKKGDTVALFMENRPELVFFWLGLSKIGVAAALVNYNLRNEPLSHCISIVNSKGLIYSSDASIADAVSDIHNSIRDTELFEFGTGSSSSIKAKNILEELKTCSEERPVQVHEKRYDDVLFYIYTSGTTGLPKASVIRHLRYFVLSVGWSKGLKVGPRDIIYCVLPLYHSAAGIAGSSAVLTFGATMVVRRKFSASRFWEECIKYNATGTQYIGELCRYLLAQPPKETDTKHSLRFASGNGLRPQIWKEFQTRFSIPLIGEFYAATEGNASVFNFMGYPGAAGFIPATFPQLAPMRIFKMDPCGEELMRGPDGLCIPCDPGEIGQIAGRIDQKDPQRRFDGYVNQAATKKKIARDVLKKGDQWFLSGDTVFWDELGYVYFHDRLGDTFRWRGENVSTTEVEGVMSKVLGLNSVVVYGVEVPGCEGRAGMAAIEDPDDVIEIEFLGKKLSEVLPSYARPVFLRITNSVDTTGTFKLKKSKLRKEGFDISIVADKLFYLDQKTGEYDVLTKEIYGKFGNCQMRV